MISPRFVRRLSRLLQYGLLSLFFAFVAMPMAVIV